MARAWIGLILLSLLASQVDGYAIYGKKPLPYPWNIYFWLIFWGGFLFLCCCVGCCVGAFKECFGIEENRGTREENRATLTRNPSWERHQWNVQLSKVNESKPSTSVKSHQAKPPSSEKRVCGVEEEHLLPGKRVTVQLVDEQLVDLEVPPGELTLTTFTKLLSDLTYYAGVPELQGLLVKSESGGFVQVFDMNRIPQGNLKVRAVISGEKHFLRIYPNPQLEE